MVKGKAKRARRAKKAKKSFAFFALLALFSFPHTIPPQNNLNPQNNSKMKRPQIFCVE